MPKKAINFLGNKWKNYILHIKRNSPNAMMETADYIERLQEQINDLQFEIERLETRVEKLEKRVFTQIAMIDDCK